MFQLYALLNSACSSTRHISNIIAASTDMDFLR